MVVTMVLYFALTAILAVLARSLEKMDGYGEIKYEDLGWLWWALEPNE